MSTRWLALAAVATTLSVALIGGPSTARPGARALGYVCPPALKLPGPDLRFHAADGTSLVGHAFGHGPVTVVLANQADETLCLWVSESRRLAAQGYRVIAFDFRNSGRSQVRKPPADAAIDLDVAAAVKLARGQGAKKVFLLGASMGGWASIVAGADIRPPVQGIVSVSGPAQWSRDAVPFARRLTVPVLYLASSLDGSFPTDARTLYQATGSHDKTLKIIPGPFHGTALVEFRPAARAAVDTFLRKHSRS